MNYEALRDQLEKNMTPQDIQELNDLKEESVQGRANLQSRILRFGNKPNARQLSPVQCLGKPTKKEYTGTTAKMTTSIHTNHSRSPSPLFTQRDSLIHN